MYVCTYIFAYEIMQFLCGILNLGLFVVLSFQFQFTSFTLCLWRKTWRWWSSSIFQTHTHTLKVSPHCPEVFICPWWSAAVVVEDVATVVHDQYLVFYGGLASWVAFQIIDLSYSQRHACRYNDDTNSSNNNNNNNTRIFI